MVRRPAWLSGLSRHPVSFGNVAKPGARERVTSIAQYVATLFDPSADWASIAQVRKTRAGPFVGKCIMHPDDARAAVRAGAGRSKFWPPNATKRWSSGVCDPAEITADFACDRAP